MKRNGFFSKLSSPMCGPIVIGKSGFDSHRKRYNTYRMGVPVPFTKGKLEFKKLQSKNIHKYEPYKVQHLAELASNPYMKVVVKTHSNKKDLDPFNPIVSTTFNYESLGIMSVGIMDEDILDVFFKTHINHGYKWDEFFVVYEVHSADSRNLVIGDPNLAWSFHKWGWGPFYSTFGAGGQANVAYDPYNQEWVGFSHRGRCGFGVGDKLFKKNQGGDTVPFKLHGRHYCSDLNDAFLAACNFANYMN